MPKIKWHLQAKQVENRIDFYHNSNRDEDHIECKQTSQTIMVRIKMKLTSYTSKKQSRFIS